MTVRRRNQIQWTLSIALNFYSESEENPPFTFTKGGVGKEGSKSKAPNLKLLWKKYYYLWECFPIFGNCCEKWQMQLIENHYRSRQLKTCMEKVEKKPNLVDLAPLWECSHILCPEEQNRRGGDHSLSPAKQSRPHVCVSHLVCTGSDTLEVWSRILRHFRKREVVRIKEEMWWEKVVYYLFYPAVQYVWRHTRWLSLLQATTPLLWKLAARRSEHGRRLFHWSRQNSFSRPSPCGVASNSQHVKSLGVQIAEQGGRFFFWN